MIRSSPFIRKTTGLACLLCGLAFVGPAPAAAEEASSAQRKLDDRFVGGSTFSVGSRHFQVIDNLTAKKHTTPQTDPNAQPTPTRKIGPKVGAQVGAQTDRVAPQSEQSALPAARQNPRRVAEPTQPLKQKGNFGIFLDDADPTPSFSAQSSGQAGGAQSGERSRARAAGELPVVQNTRTGVLGVVTGVVSFKYRQGENGEAIAAEYGYMPDFTLEPARLVFVRVSNNMNEILNAYNRLQQDHRLERASIDILEHPYQPQ